MKNTFGNSVAITLFGESHGEYIGAVIDGLASGIRIDREYIDNMLTLRRPSGRISTPRQEKDEYKIIVVYVTSIKSADEFFNTLTALLARQSLGGAYKQRRIIKWL